MNSSASAPSLTKIMLFASLPLRSARSASSASAGLYSTNRTSTFSNLSILRPSRQRKIKRGSFTPLPLGPDAPAVPGHDTAHDGKPHADAGELRFRMQALKHAEQLLVIMHVEPGAVVLDAVLALCAVRATAQFDHRLLALAAELDRVRQQVGPHLLDQRGGAPCLGKGG